MLLSHLAEPVTAAMHPGPAVDLRPCLEYLADESSEQHRIVLNRLPFCLGRAETADGVIPCQQVSRRHAEIYQDGPRILVRDLNSANGTFVNGRRVTQAVLAPGTLLALACREYRFTLESAHADHDPSLTEVDLTPRNGLIRMRPLLEELLRQRAVISLFQPIVDLGSGETMGQEALGRGTHPDLSARPIDLFGLAERYKLANELSRLFRGVAVEESKGLPDQPALFLNLHPAELKDPTLLDSLQRLRRQVPGGQRVVVEVHEDTVADLNQLRNLRERLHGIGIHLAYDDFGTGQARLAELAEVTPDFIKLDMGLIRGIHASAQRQLVVKAIVAAADDLGCLTIAEGIETEAEATTCRQLGCHYGQGYLLGYPTRVDQLTPISTLRFQQTA